MRRQKTAAQRRVAIIIQVTDTEEANSILIILLGSSTCARRGGHTRTLSSVTCARLSKSPRGEEFEVRGARVRRRTPQNGGSAAQVRRRVTP